ncbi:MAG: leucine-rich repeat protein [Oscillospiraceae bacterium]|nr:leucine-rich repeat protein [Oscillospiraceae bacterium]
MKKLVSILLVLAMVCCLLPTAAFAEETAGTLVTLEYPEDLCTITVTDRNNSSATVENGSYLTLGSNGKASAIFEIENIAEGYRIAEVILNGKDYTVNFITGAYGGMARSGISEDVTLSVTLEEIPDLPVLESFEIYTDDTYTQTLDTDLILTEAVQIYIKGIYSDGGAYPDYTARGHMEYTLDGTTWEWTQWGGDYWYFPLNDTFYTDFNPLADSYDFRICIEPDGLYCTGDAVYSDVYHVNGGAGGFDSADDNETERDDTISGTCGVNLTWKLDGEGVLTVSGDGPMWDFVEEVPGWNLYGGHLTHVVIEPGVTSIGANAFSMCSMESIDIPDTVTSIGKQAFYFSELESAVIPASVTQFGEAIFCQSMLGDVTLPDNMTEIPNEMFYGCGLTSIEIPESVASIGDNAFYLTDIDRVTVPAGVVSVGNMAFGNYVQVKYAEITFLGDAPAIEDGAFGYQNVTIYYPEGNTTWDAVISGYVPGEGDHATFVAKSSGNTELPPSEPISGYCGYCEECYGYGDCGDCGQNLTWTLAGGQLTISGEGDMGTWGSAVHQPWYDCRDFITSIVVESGVTSIGAYAFYGLDYLNSVTIGEGVTEIHGHSMKYCKNLAHVTLPSTIQEMGGSTFFGSDLLTSAGPIGSGCAIEFAWTEHIPTGAFDSHTALSEVILPETLKTIGDNAFLDCFALASIELPDGLVSIGQQAFEETALTAVVIPDSVTEMGAEAFQYCPLTELKLSENLTVIPSTAFSYCDELTAVVIPEAVTEIGAGAFECCKALTEIVIPGNVTRIGARAFQVCDALTSVTLPGSLTYIGSGAFGGCIALEEIVIPANVETLGASAFGGCTGLAEITFEGAAPGFDTYVFRDVVATAYYPAAEESWTENVMKDYGGTITWEAYGEALIPGDTDGDGAVDDSDVAQLLWYTLFPDAYTVSGDADINGDGKVDDADVAYLLWHTLFPDAYPIG